MTNALTAAVDAVALAIAERAQDSTGSPEDLKSLAEGLALLKFGPDGYAGSVDYTYTSNNRTRTLTDYHETTHPQGDERRKPTGFADAWGD